MDCTYEANQHGMPMLHITGFSSRNQTLTAAATFLSQETVGCYSLALEAFSVLLTPPDSSGFDESLRPGTRASLRSRRAPPK